MDNNENLNTVYVNGLSLLGHCRTDLFTKCIVSLLLCAWLFKVTSSPRDFDCGEPAAKKCKNCDINEIRLQLIKNKAVKLKRAEEELNKKIFITCKKSNKLLAVLGTLVKSLNSKMPGSARCLLTVSADKEKVLREQVPLLVSDNRMTLFPTKNSLNAGNVTFESILTKLLLSSRDQSLSPDGS